MALTFTDSNFEAEVLKSDVPVLVDFWASWCGPCQILGPIIDELATEMEGKAVKIGKLSVEENTQTPQNYGVMSIPTLILFKNGEIVETLIGVQEKDALKAKLEAAMG